jgi:hypothetical protein
MHYTCCKDDRRNLVLGSALNGIDFLEVQDERTDPFAERQTTLYLHLLKPVNVGQIKPENIAILGGERIKNIRVLHVKHDIASPLSPLSPLSPASPPEPDGRKVLEIKVSEAGDFSIYTLSLRLDPLHPNQPPAGFDQILSAIDFSFKILCPTYFDCKPVHHCKPTTPTTPEINYLAKDYASFRQVMLDRMSLLVPAWKERNPADTGIMLIELLAYTADYLSYKQDAITTEAYLGTARKRSSVRRHARLVDYFMHDGCNARVWIQICLKAASPSLLIKKRDVNNGTSVNRFLTKSVRLNPAGNFTSKEVQDALKEGVQVFEPKENQDITLYPEHNEIHFYTWSQDSCCLPKGAVSATLEGHFPNLSVGQILILMEKIDPVTGVTEDANPAHRQAVQLTKITAGTDTLNGQQYTEITWHTDDALHFPLCISAKNHPVVGVALGNIVMADHGFTQEDGTLSSLFPDTVPAAILSYPGATTLCSDTPPVAIPARYRPQLKYRGLTFAAALAGAVSATGKFKIDLRTVKPEIQLRETNADGVAQGKWTPYYDLLNASSEEKGFVVEMENDGAISLRFGDSRQGERPESGRRFWATYRLGNGPYGNVGANTIQHFASSDPAVVNAIDFIEKVWNPMPAQGGIAPENMEEVRQYAPEAFRTQQRAVTNADYEYFAPKLKPDVQRAAATLRWTGSWKTVFLTVDRFGGGDVTADFEKELRAELEPYRMAGYDLEVDGPLFVNLEVEIKLYIKPGYLAGDVRRALLEVFSNRVLADGSKGVFHPDQFTFGQPVYLSKLYAAAQNITGVSSVEITKLCRQGDKIDILPVTGVFKLGRREIARCDNDPNFPERGSLKITIVNQQ